MNAQTLQPRALQQLRRGSFEVLQLDATAYPGNSGGPVFSLSSGEVAGVISMVLVKGTREAALSAPSGISYAIKAADSRRPPQVGCSGLSVGIPYSSSFIAMLAFFWKKIVI